MRSINIFLFCVLESIAFAQWVPQNSGTEASFRAISAVNTQVVWAGGTKGTVLRTTNGGDKWEVLKVPHAEQLDFRGIHGIDANTAIAVSAGLAEEGQAKVYRTADAGQNWQQVWQTDQKGVFLDGIAFWDKKNGLIFGDPIAEQWFLLRTTDGGQTWQRISPVLLPHNLAGEAAFAASNSSMAVQGKNKVWIGTGGADHARVFYSTDRGNSWKVADTPMKAGASSGIFGLRFWNATHGMAVGGDYKMDKVAFENVVMTQDGGKTWQKSTPTLPAGLREAVVKLKNGSLIAAGPSGSSISRDNGQTWQALENSPAGLHALASAGNTCWGIGAKGVIVVLK
ncbi:MAG: oxidoreductase [Spirosomataceae bacterium]